MFVEPETSEELVFTARIDKTNVLVKVKASYVPSGQDYREGSWEILEAKILDSDVNLVEILSHAQVSDLEETAAALHVERLP